MVNPVSNSSASNQAYLSTKITAPKKPQTDAVDMSKSELANTANTTSTANSDINARKTVEPSITKATAQPINDTVTAAAKTSQVLAQMRNQSDMARKAQGNADPQRAMSLLAA